MNYNRVVLGDWVNNDLPDKSVDLIIADPPYYKIKGDFDFVYSDFEAYLALNEVWAKECARVLRNNGTLIWYGHAKRIAYAQVVFDRYFELLNNGVWYKKDAQTKKMDYSKSRSFVPVTERFLVYGSRAYYSEVREYMCGERDKLMLDRGFRTIAEFGSFVNKWTGTSSIVSNHYFANSQFQFPTEAHYLRLQETGFWQLPYADLLKWQRHFDNSHKLTDILTFSQEAHITSNYGHDTQKPETLTRALLLACSKKDDFVLVPFAGSGTECAMAAKEGRRYLGFDINAKYVDMANDRCKAACAAYRLF